MGATLMGGPVSQPSFDALMYGIGIQESGGSNYSVVNSIGAVGKYQVMKANIPSWSKKVLGHSISWQEFRNSPDLQEKIVRGILSGYYKKYGARGAASMWYSGQPNPNKSYGNPPVSTYVNSVINHAGSYSGKTYTGSGIGGDPVVPKLDQKELAEQYGFTMSFLNANPDLKKKFQQMVSEGWSKEMFQAKLRETGWWKHHSDKERQYLTQMFTDPATARQSLSQASTTVRQLANQLGIKENSFTKKKMSEASYNRGAKGWYEGQLR